MTSPLESTSAQGDSSGALSLRGTLWSDSKNAMVATLLGLAAVALIDFIATVWVAPGPPQVATLLRYVLLELSLCAVLGILALPLMVSTSIVARGFHLLLGKGQRWAGLFGPSAPSRSGRKLASCLWALCISGSLYLGASTLMSLKLGAMFKEPQLTALVLAFAQLVVALALLGLAFLLSLGVQRLGRLLPANAGPLNPFTSVPAAAIALVLIGWPLVILVLRALPQLAPYVPWRHMLSLGSFALGVWASGQLLARRGRLLPASGRKQLITVAVSVFLCATLFPITLIKLGADQDTKALAISSSPTLATAMNLVRRANDFDGDGFGSLLGENDCGAFNDKVHPLARDIPDNGIDENCDGRDFKLGRLPSYKSGEKMPIPEAYQQDWNVLLITVDTVRYDHTSFGDYKRNTTPRLAEFVKRSANFVFANAPSAGTMASIPAILTSKFFHSGIALKEDIPRGSPPKLKPSNTLIHEVFKKKGYRTGAILSHEYFNDWGMDQGVDDYDNTVGKKRDPYGVTSPKLTDRSIAWIGKQGSKKWFLWTHYIDPHGRYVSHPGETSYGESEMDLYDGELHFTDKHLGNLLDYVARSPAGKNTIIAITSDHGDAFGEHGYINHAQDLHREILHVPLIFYVPNIEPRAITGAVSPIDIFPTLADLIGADISALGVEGESLVPQLFYGRDAEERVVFSETNFPKPLRAAVNSRYKLILDLKNNVSRLWDLKKDPMEKKNVWTTDKTAYKEMRGYLNEWLERVLYSRDAESNQTIAKLADHLVRDRPASATPVEGVAADDGKIVVDSFELDVAKAIAGKPLEIQVYYRVAKPGAPDMKIQLEAWVAEGPNRTRPAKSRLGLTGGGMFPSSRWHHGELVRDRMKISLPTAWKKESGPAKVMLGLRFKDNTKSTPKKGPISLEGPLREGTSDLVMIGEFTMPEPVSDAPTPPKPLPGKGLPGKGLPGKGLPGKTVPRAPALKRALKTKKSAP
ncbi:MAG: sulfatase-like hydrolase/transferase [Myxococcales bacterium]|nr:sulfatase-like hydrolase/transferase [Myxococcales bacterium]